MNKTVLFERLENLIREYGPKRLSDQSGISRQGIYRLLTERNPRFETLEKIASTLKLEFDFTKILPDREQIYSSLKHHGGPIMAKPTSHPLYLEETLARGIELSRTDGFISSIIPYVLSKKSADFNIPHLIALCDQLGESRTLGYYSEMATHFKTDDRLQKMANLLFEGHFKRESLAKHLKITESFKHLAQITNNPIAKKWKFMTIDNFKNQLERFNKWQRQRE